MSLPDVGTVFESRYRLDSILGAGGFATVYLATDVAADRRVALKILRTSIGGYDAAIRSRFEREVRILANLRDPHTITMFDFGTSSTGLLYMVTEFVPGQDLSQLLEQRGRLEPHEVIHILQQLLHALREAHSHGLLHRDIKPANVRITNYMGDPLHAKLLDFGIAKAVEGGQQITEKGELVGTLRYMSPEQLLSTSLTPASDLYSLGIVGFELLLGHQGIHGSELHHQMDRLNTGHVFSVPELERVGPQLARALDKMTARDVSERFGSADEVLAVLSSTPPVPSLIQQPPSGQYSQPHGPSTSMSQGLRAPPPTMSGAMAAPPHTGTYGAPAPSTLREPPAANKNLNLALIAGGLLVVLGILGAVVISMRSGDEAPVDTSRERRNLGIVRAEEVPAKLEVTRVEDEPVVEPAAVDMGPAVKFPKHYSAGCGQPAQFLGRGALEFDDGGLSRNLLDAYIFPEYLPTRAWPLIVMLHENFETPMQFMTYSKLPQLAKEREFLIIAPAGLSPYAWDTSGEFEKVRASIRETLNTLCVDTRRVYIVAHASGGKIAERAPCEMPEIAAIATSSHRGEIAKVDTTCVPEEPIPYLHIAPTKDRFNPIKGGVGCSKVAKLSLAEKEEMWRERNNCQSRKEKWLEHKGSTCYRWECDAEFAVCQVDGGRGWPGTGKRMIDFNNCDGDPARFPYAKTIWEFFSRHAPE